MDKRKKGFTLIELMIVVAILGTLASIAVPKFANMIRKAKEGATKGALGAMRSAISMYYSDSEGEHYPNLLNGLFPNYISGSGYAEAGDSFITIGERIDWTDGEKSGNSICDGWCDGNAGDGDANDDPPWPGPFPGGIVPDGDGVLCKYRPAQENAADRGGWNYCPRHGAVWVDELGADTMGTPFTSW